jgi:DNA end-binding protein Ku
LTRSRNWALPAEMLKLAEQIIEIKTDVFDPVLLEDHYRTAMVEILRKKQARIPAQAKPVVPSTENVVSLMDALRRSLRDKKPPAKSASERRSSGSRRTPAKPTSRDRSPRTK